MKRFKNILLLYECDRATLDRAATLAKNNRARLTVIHAWTLLYENLMRGRGGFAESEIRNCADGEERRHRTLLDALLTKHTDGTATVHLIEGDAEVVLPQFAKSQNVDLLVMGTVCRTGIPGFLIGNTAEKILDEVKCSVLTVKPEGFVSPVKLA